MIFDVIDVSRRWVEHAQCNSDRLIVLTDYGVEELIHEVDEYEERIREYEEKTIDGGSLFDGYEDV